MDIKIETLLGKWQLISFKIHLVGLSWNWGNHAAGFIEYHTTGKMNVEIYSQKNSFPNVANLLFNDQLVYGGPYKLEGQKIQHHLEYCSKKSWTGRNLTREIIAVDEDNLTLKGGNILLNYVLIWKH
jgi:hypothetical protein